MPCSAINKKNLDSLVNSAQDFYTAFSERLRTKKGNQAQQEDLFDRSRTEFLINSLHKNVNDLSNGIDSIFNLKAHIIPQGMGWGSINEVVFNPKVKRLRDLIKAFRYIFATLLNSNGNTHPNEKMVLLANSVKADQDLYYMVMSFYRQFMEMSTKLDRALIVLIDKWLRSNEPVDRYRKMGLL